MDSVIINNNTHNGSVENNEIRLDLSTYLELHDKQLALQYLGIYYSWRNIQSSYNNNKLQYRWVDDVVYDVNIPDGFYSIEDLSAYMQKVMHDNRHYMFDANGDPVYFIEFESNSVYYCTTFFMSPVVIPPGGSNSNLIVNVGKTPQIIIPANNITTALGVDAGTYPAAYGTTIEYAFRGQKVPQISPVTTLNVACNITTNNLNRNKKIIYQFSPTQTYGSYLVIEPSSPVFYKIVNGSYSDISLTFLDQDFKPINLIDKNITATLLIADTKK